MLIPEQTCRYEYEHCIRNVTERILNKEYVRKYITNCTRLMLARSYVSEKNLRGEEGKVKLLK